MTQVFDTGDVLLEWSSLRVTGEDAHEFLQGQITQNVSAAVGGAWTFILEPDSTVLCLGWLHTSGEDFFIDVPVHIANTILLRLKRFVLRSKVAIEVTTCDQPVLLTMSEAFEALFPVGFPEGKSTPHSYGELWIRQAVSFDKGCYTGQELVGRLVSRGAPVPFSIVRLHSISLESTMELIRQGPQSTKQEVLSGFTNDSGTYCFALLHRSVLGDQSLLVASSVEILPVAIA